MTTLKSFLFSDLIFTCLVDIQDLIALDIDPPGELDLLFLMQQRPREQLWRREATHAACPQIL